MAVKFSTKYRVEDFAAVEDNEAIEVNKVPLFSFVLRQLSLPARFISKRDSDAATYCNADSDYDRFDQTMLLVKMPHKWSVVCAFQGYMRWAKSKGKYYRKFHLKNQNRRWGGFNCSSADSYNEDRPLHALKPTKEVLKYLHSEHLNMQEGEYSDSGWPMFYDNPPLDQDGDEMFDTVYVLHLEQLKLVKV